jgi:DNA-binding NtrC family response regulator
VRVLAATNRNIAERVRQGQFREDLYYRLHVVPIIVPPLRERREDISLLANRFLRRAAVRFRKEIAGFSPEAAAALENYSWPGNVRELENLVERLAILVAKNEISVADLPAEIRDPQTTSEVGGVRGQGMVSDSSPGFSHHLAGPSSGASKSAVRSMEQMEKETIEDVLRRVNGNVREAARLLGLGLATVYRKIKRYGIASPGGSEPPELEQIEEEAS